MIHNLDPDANRGADCDRAARALQQLFGGASSACSLPSIPAALSMPEIDLLLVAGDNRKGLSAFALKPLALAHGVNVIATWADGILTGHAFEIDAVLIDSGQAVQFSAYRLWIAPRRASALGAPALADASEPDAWHRLRPGLDAARRLRRHALRAPARAKSHPLK